MHKCMILGARVSMSLTAHGCRARIVLMEDEEKTTPTTSAQDEWVRMDPDRPAYQKLHLCLYLAELPELTTSEPEAKDSR